MKPKMGRWRQWWWRAICFLNGHVRVPNPTLLGMADHYWCCVCERWVKEKREKKDDAPGSHQPPSPA